MLNLFSLSALVLGATVALATPSFALDGGDAVEQCQATPNCDVHVNTEGNILIQGPKGGTVWCKSSRTQCEVVRHGRVAPTQNEDEDEAVAVIKTVKGPVVLPTFGTLSGDTDHSDPAPTAPGGKSFQANLGGMSNAPVL